MYSAIDDEPTKPIALTRGSVSSVSTASLSPLTTLSTPSGSPASRNSSAMPHRHRRIALRRLEDEGVAAGDRGRALPHRDHGREVERRDAGDDAERLAHRIEVDAGAGAFGELALQQVRNAAGELHHLEAALDVALGVGEGLAVLGGQQPGEVVVFGLHQLEELEHDAGAALRIGRGPGRLGGWRRWRWPARPRTCWRSATLACTSPVFGLNTSPDRPEVPLTSLPPMKWPISRI